MFKWNPVEKNTVLEHSANNLCLKKLRKLTRREEHPVFPVLLNQLNIQGEENGIFNSKMSSCKWEGPCYFSL